MSSSSLASACDRLVAVARRHLVVVTDHDAGREDAVASVADAATTCVEVSQTYVRGLEDSESSEPSGTGRLGRSLLRAIRAVRRFSLERAVSSRGGDWWASCDPLSLVETGPWDGLHLLLFLTECHLRVCVAKLFSDERRGWAGVVGTRDGNGDENRVENRHGTVQTQTDQSDDSDPRKRTRADEDDVVRGTDADVDDAVDDDAREALERGLEPRRIGALLTDDRLCRSTMALVVCLDDVVPSEERDADPGMFNGTRPSRLGVRLLERHALSTDAVETLERELASRSVLDDGVASASASASTVVEWTRRTIEVDANNALLLRMDEWGVIAALRPREVAFATGERGSVPQEHRNAPAAWVAQRARPDDAYRELMKTSKQNADHPENAYVCFSGALEQHHAFDWLTRCFVSRLSPVVALRKVREYLASARPRTAPLVIESATTTTTKGAAVVLYRSSIDETFRRRACATPHEAVRAWMEIVRDNAGGAFSRKANVADVMDRIENPPNLAEKKEAPSEIGGASLRVN